MAGAVSSYTYPFGRPITPREPSATSPRRLFVLGAYPSALHVEWIPPKPWKRITAIPIDDEPSPFWDGADHEARVDAWKAHVGFDPAWGSIQSIQRFNGPSGAWVRDNVLEPLEADTSGAWITDCLDTYRGSIGVTRRLSDTYGPFATALGLPAASLPPHPGETEIVQEALTHHTARLRAELGTARPELVVTLGNAALRVLGAIVDIEGRSAPSKLRVEEYGKEIGIRVAGRSMRWLPLAHPAAPKRWQEVHEGWARGMQVAGPGVGSVVGSARQ